MSPDVKQHIWEAIERLKRASVSTDSLTCLLEMKEASNHMIFASHFLDIKDNIPVSNEVIQ